MDLFPRGSRSRRLAAFAVAGVMFAVGASLVSYYQADRGAQAPFSAVWDGLAPSAAATAKDAAGDPPPAMAPSLGELLPGLEAKAAANPADAGTQILLAQTYAELGRRADGLRVLERLAKTRPDDGEVAFAHASLLGQGDDVAALRSASELYDRAARLAPRLTGLARLHQGEVRVRLGDRAGAIRLWEEHLGRFPDEPRRALFEAAIAQARTAAAGS